MTTAKGPGGRKPGFRWSEDHRQRIRVGELLKRVQGFALGENDPQSGRPIEMSAPQVTAALKLIGKAIPDLAAVQLSGDKDNPIAVVKVTIGASASVDDGDG